jgi:hypothetical protein
LDVFYQRGAALRGHSLLGHRAHKSRYKGLRWCSCLPPLSELTTPYLRTSSTTSSAAVARGKSPRGCPNQT